MSILHRTHLSDLLLTRCSIKGDLNLYTSLIKSKIKNFLNHVSSQSNTTLTKLQSTVDENSYRVFVMCKNTWRNSCSAQSTCGHATTFTCSNFRFLRFTSRKV